MIAVFPFDQVAWTERVGGVFEKVASAAPHEQGQPVLATTGELTPLAQEEVAKLGWTVQSIR